MKTKVKGTEGLESVLHGKYEFKYNEITNKLFFRRKRSKEFRELNDYQLNSILREIRSEEEKYSKTQVAELLNSDFTPIVNPFKEYFGSLAKPSDKDDDYIAMLADTVKVVDGEKAQWPDWFKKWIVAVVASAVNDDIVNHTMLIFIGAQNIGKTTWLKNLVPNALRKYHYSGGISLGNKDTEVMLAENLLINLDELQYMGSKHISSFKEIVTKPMVKIRRPYAAYAEHMPHRASFTGSLNNREFLHDNTGSRRFLCFETLEIKRDHGIDMDKVYAQAYHLYMGGFQYWFDGKEVDEINAHNTAYCIVPLEQEILEEYFEPVSGNEEPDYMMGTEDLLGALIEKSTVAKRMSVRKLGMALSKSNWPKKKTGGRRVWLLKEKVRPGEVPEAPNPMSENKAA